MTTRQLAWNDIARFAAGSVLRVEEAGGHPLGVVLRAAVGDLLLPAASEACPGSTAHPLTDWLVAAEGLRGERPPLGRVELVATTGADRAAAAAARLPVCAVRRGFDPGWRLVLGPFAAGRGVRAERPAGGWGALAARAFPPGTVVSLRDAAGAPLRTLEVALDAAARPVALEVGAHLGCVVAPLEFVPAASRRPWRARVPSAREARPVVRLRPQAWAP